MSNFLAVASVTATLSRILGDAVASGIPGARVSLDPPLGTGHAGGGPTVNIFLYQVTPNVGWKNLNLPTRAADGGLVDRPRAALDLHYLLSFAGDEAKFEPQRMLGTAVAALESTPVLSRRQVHDTVTGNTYLLASNLEDEVELVKFTLLALSLEDLSKLWSVFFQVKYTLSVAYQATVVLIEGEDRPRVALPVQAREVYVVPSRQPRIERVTAQAGEDRPVLVGDGILIWGTQLDADGVIVRIGEAEAPPSEATESRIVLPFSLLPATALRAGVQSVQVLHPLVSETPPPPTGIESNVAAFVLHPEVTSIARSGMTGSGAGPYSGRITIGVRPAAGPRQRLFLQLNRAPAEGSQSHAFSAPARTSDAGSIRFAVDGLAAGHYLCRIQVDGAESPLAPGPGGSFATPVVTIP